MQQQQGILKSSRERDNETLEAVRQSWQETNEKRVRYIVPLRQPKTRQPLPNQPVQNAKICRWCGKSSHPHQSCLTVTKATTSFCCSRKAHYTAQCLSKTVAEIDGLLQELTLNVTGFEKSLFQPSTHRVATGDTLFTIK